ncbi:MAG: pilus assembly protein TadG-related protein [Gaiellaceae bacterium]
MKFFRNDRGQATVLTVLSLTALLGMAALVLDLGSWFRAQRETQAAADASALAAAQALPDEPGTAAGLAGEYVLKNGGGTHTVTFTSKNVTNDTVRVKVERTTPGFFAKVFGIDSVQVGAGATARASGLEKAKWVAPITVNIKHPQLNCGSAGTPPRPVPCFGQPTQLDLLNLKAPNGPDAAGAFGLINLDRADSGSVGSDTLSDWVTRGFDEYMDLGIYTSVPSAKFNDSKFKSALDVRTGDVLLFPVYTTIQGSGSNAEYDVVGWVGFEVTQYHAGGSTGWVRGSFTEVTWEGVQSQSGAGLNYGVRAIQLVE